MRNASDVHVEVLREDKKLRLIHLQNAINMIFSTDSRVALLMLRDVINASIGFQELAIKVGKSDKNIMGMLTGSSNPTLDSISRIINAIIEHEQMVPTTTLKRKTQ